MAAQSEHHETVASGALAPFVTRVVGYRLSGFEPGVHVGMPSSTLTLVVPLDAPLTLSSGRSGRRRDVEAVVAGLAVAPEHIHHDGVQHGVQLALHPDAAPALFGVPAAALAHESFELGDVLDELVGAGAVSTLRERMHETDCWTTRFALVLGLLTAARSRVGDRPAAGRVAPEVQEAWRVVERSDGRVPVRDVARSVGWSVRHLQQRFGAAYGLGPKAAARVRRFERSVPLVSAARLPLTRVALDCGWSDHAHMDRDWRDLAGTSPSRWRADDALIGT
ncbi:helix-turn-helix domain-containing protein [Terracoccus luteus]|uniref:AraC family transcriptional regulator n=1 Tax=Terracoccus luteus TaxID=53356 RepID=A0A495XXS7_9MICO|nr:AraC family transcriptional regulator [Terracoccus luteus]MBB2985087.1 AraC-like DNA-binding protein [Terracoccus luteus]MCP2170739.1 AraC-like DNA-binding protein [Terracoccus luteus]RKT77654.1 AraC family transcriptional regulator [Terracoccus luteus]